MDHEHFEEMVALYAAGALETLECQEFEEHLQAGCEVCPNLLRDFQETLSLLPHGLATAEVPPHLKSQIMEKISETVAQAVPKMESEPEPRSVGTMWKFMALPVFRPAFTVLILLILAGTGYYSFSLRSQLEGAIDQRQHITEVLDETDSKIALLRQKVAGLEQIVDDLRSEQKTDLAKVAALDEEVEAREAEFDRLQTQLAEQEEETGFLRRVVS